jgi:poly(A) polymerase
VTFSTPEEDAKRRDFTINAMFYDPVKEKLIDYVGGKKDLEDKLIRCVGDPKDRFSEDPLRILRAIRFLLLLPGFRMETVTSWGAFNCVAMLATLSVERIREEFVKIMLNSKDKEKAFDTLVSFGAMRHIINEVICFKTCDQSPEFHPEGNVYQHVCKMLSLMQYDAPLPLILAVLLHDIAKPVTKTRDEKGIHFYEHEKVGADMSVEILQRLKFPNDIIEQVREMVYNHMKFNMAFDMKKSTLKRFMALPTFPMLLELHRLDAAGSNGDMSSYEYMKEQYETKEPDQPALPKPLVNGNDLIKLGMKPGPDMGKLLFDIQTKQLDGELNTYGEAIGYAIDFLGYESQPIE